MHAFDCVFHCAFDKSNVCGSHSNANALQISRRHLNAHSDAQYSNSHSNAFTFVKKPGVTSGYTGWFTHNVRQCNVGGDA